MLTADQAAITGLKVLMLNDRPHRVHLGIIEAGWSERCVGAEL